jgi:hypothetical protein
LRISYNEGYIYGILPDEGLDGYESKRSMERGVSDQSDSQMGEFEFGTSSIERSVCHWECVWTTRWSARYELRREK